MPQAKLISHLNQLTREPVSPFLSGWRIRFLKTAGLEKFTAFPNHDLANRTPFKIDLKFISDAERF